MKVRVTKKYFEKLPKSGAEHDTNINNLQKRHVECFFWFGEMYSLVRDMSADKCSPCDSVGEE